MMKFSAQLGARELNQPSIQEQNSPPNKRPSMHAIPLLLNENQSNATPQRHAMYLILHDQFDNNAIFMLRVSSVL